MESLVCMTNAFTALRRILILTGSTAPGTQQLVLHLAVYADTHYCSALYGVWNMTFQHRYAR